MNAPVGIFKLVTGEEVVAEFADVPEQPTVVQISKPRKLMIIPKAPGKFEITFIPWIVGEPDGTFIISMGSIVAMSEANAGLTQRWLQETSQLELATAQSPLIQK